MGRNTKIDWADDTWNPITGCNHGCEYCYARGIATRYEGHDTTFGRIGHEGCSHVLDEPLRIKSKSGDMRKAAFPFGFDPTLHRYRLDIPKRWSEPRTIFVGSMADVFGDWVPDEWIKQVLDACRAAPQHRYLFLSKNPSRYVTYNGGEHLDELPDTPMYWYGTSITKRTEIISRGYELKLLHNHFQCNTFASVEPILEDFGHAQYYEYIAAAAQWVIVGTESGNRKGKVIPERAWIEKLVKACDRFSRPIFMKESLRDLMGSDFRQEFPWAVDMERMAGEQAADFADAGGLAPAT